MIHYHGGPITPIECAQRAWTGRHAMISFANPEQLPLAAEICQSFALDNGAFPIWRAGKGSIDVSAYLEWVSQWLSHPGFDWCLIPDRIDGTEAENRVLVDQWRFASSTSVPVWHLHESLNWLEVLVSSFPRVALGSSGRWSQVGTSDWWGRMAEAMEVACDSDGRPRTKLHGLRMLDPTIFSQLPLASADSTNVARNIGIDKAWIRGQYQPMTKAQRAAVLIDRIEHHASAARWCKTMGVQKNFELVG